MVDVIRPADVETSDAVGHAVERCRNRWATTTLIFDFDGVLSPIGPDPRLSRPLPEAEASVARLVPAVGRLAIVSSRPADFLIGVFGGIPGLTILGSYGLERVTDGRTELDPSVPAGWAETIGDLRRGAEKDFAAERFTGLYVEDKGIAVGLHYRNVGDRSCVREVESWAERHASRIGAALKLGREVVEIAPRSDVDKGTAVAREIVGFDAAWYFGDDRGDVPAFRAVREADRPAPGFAGIAVGVMNDVVVDEVIEETTFMVSAPDAVVALLDRIERSAG